MKTKSLYLAFLVLGLITWNCNKTDNQIAFPNSASLKSSINTGVQQLTTAMNAISTSAGKHQRASWVLLVM